MRCLVRYFLILVEVWYFVTLMSVNVAYGHVGEKCHFVIILKICTARNAYCDQDNICQCKSEYPVKVDDHTCKKARRIGERCSVNAECSHLDSNAYCTQLSYRSVCECHDGFQYNSAKDNCEKIPNERSSNPSLVLPISVGFCLALACLICCCLASVHICRTRRRHRNRRNGRTSRPTSESGQWMSNNEAIRWSQRPPSSPSAPEDIGSLPPYEVAVVLEPMKEPDMEDECPPSYEEVIKDSIQQP